MKSTFVSKLDLAQAYFPFVDRVSARHKLMQLIYEDKALIERLIKSGFNRNGHTFSPTQFQIVVDTLGNPFK